MINAALFVDDASITITQDEEYELLKDELIRNCGDVFRFTFNVPPDKLPNSTDIYVVDFGGLNIGYGGGGSGSGSHLGDSYCRAIHRLIEDRPGTLFLIWSEFTRRWYMSMVAEELGQTAHAANVVFYPTTDDEAQAWSTIRAWLGVSEPERDTIDDVPEQDAQDDFAYYTPPPVCVMCQTMLMPCDEDPNGDKNPVCIKCRAEQAHDFDAEPYVEFDRFGRMLIAPIKEPIGYVKVPVYCQSRPEQSRMRAHFKFADCLCVVTDDDDEEELGTIGGTIGGHYEISIGNGDGHFSYIMHPPDIWEEVLKLHEQFKVNQVPVENSDG